MVINYHKHGASKTNILKNDQDIKRIQVHQRESGRDKGKKGLVLLP